MPITKIIMPFLSVFYIYIIHLMAKSLSDEAIEESRKKYVSRYILAYVIVGFVSTFIQKPLFNLVASYTAILIILNNYSDDFIDKTFNALYIDTILLISEIIGGTILGYSNIIPIQEVEMKKLTDVLIIYFFNYGAALILTKRRKVNSSKLNNSVKYSLLTVPVLSLILLIFFYSFKTIDIFQISILTMLLLLINVTSYKVYINTVNILTFKKDKEIIEEQNIFYKNQLKLMKQNEDTIKSYRHDIKNHLAVLNSLIEQDENDRAMKYLNEISASNFENEKYISSGNEIVDSIVNYKLNISKNEKIEFIIDISISPKTVISSYDMTIILGNLLDNAIEACKKISEDQRKIVLKIKEENGKFIIYVQNKFDGNIKIKEEQIVSIKQDKKNHGYGIKNIKKVVEKNGGICEFEVTNENIFTTLIVFIIDYKKDCICK